MRLPTALRFIIVCCLAGVTLCRAQPPQTTKSGLLTRKTSREALLEKGIGVDPKSLIEALSNPDAEIRGLAAMRLATDHISSGVPALRNAIPNESDQLAGFRMAMSLASLDPESGEPYVISLCQNVALGAAQNINAANVLSDLDPIAAVRSCGPTLEAIIEKRASAPDEAARALSSLARLQPKLADASAVKLRKISIELLSSKEYSLRFAAITWLTHDESDEARRAILRASDSEKDPGLRSTLRHSMESRAVHQ